MVFVNITLENTFADFSFKHFFTHQSYDHELLDYTTDVQKFDAKMMRLIYNNCFKIFFGSLNLINFPSFAKKIS